MSEVRMEGKLQKENQGRGRVVKKVSTEKMVVVSLMSALAYILMLIVPFPKYLGFLEVEFSDIPAIVTGFAYGPIAGVVVELIKNVIKAITATTTAGVGELANFLICAGFVLPSSLAFHKLKGGKKVVIAMIAGVVGITASGILVNYFITVPLYAKVYFGNSGGLDTIISICAGTIPAIDSLGKVVLLGITPFNVVKGIVIAFVGYWAYRALNVVLKQNNS